MLPPLYSGHMEKEDEWFKVITISKGREGSDVDRRVMLLKITD